MNENKTIKDLLEKEEYIIVCDTNVLLSLYRYSPEFSEFSLECLNSAVDHIAIPSTVELEFLKHNLAAFNDRNKRITKAGDATKLQINNATDKIISSLSTLKNLQFPDIQDLEASLSNKLSELGSIMDDFFIDRSVLELINDYWANQDKGLDLFNRIRIEGHTMTAVTQEEIYKICDEGENRYEKQIPPGFKDAKKKDGVRKYSDLILWKETINFAKSLKKNIIFVTDDVKIDWWIEENGIRKFHPALIREFMKESGQFIIPFVSVDFFDEIANAYGIHKTDAVELALKLTDDGYIDKIKEKVAEFVSDHLSDSGEDYIDTLTAHIASEGLTELDVEEVDYVSSKRIDRDEALIFYEFKYHVTASGTSFEYWGRDDDTKEIYLSPGCVHNFEGNLMVIVERKADIFLDFEGDFSYEQAEIASGKLFETDYENINFGNDEEDDYLPNSYNTCPDCGSRINFYNDGGNGFCSTCGVNH